MKARNILATLLLMAAGLQTAWAQQAMQIWNNGKFDLYFISAVDSVRFVNLVTDIYLSDEALQMAEGDTKVLSATVCPIDASESSVSWESSTPAVATVDQTGKVTAVAAGSCLITCSATDGSGVKAECRVTVMSSGGTGFLTCPDDHHPHAIDLGLPSGTKWCCCNVGASTPEGYGGYYAWGETSEKSYYGPSTYKYAVLDDSNGYWYDNGLYYRATNIGSDIAGTSYDVARVRMGAPWRMPSVEQMKELINNCSRQWTQQNGVNGILVTGRNGGQVFLPAAGGRRHDELYYAGSYGYYWSSSLDPDFDYCACCLYFDSGYWLWDVYYRDYGRSVRAVCP